MDSQKLNPFDIRMANRKEKANVSSPEQLDKYLRSTKPITWIILFSIVFSLVGFFIWASVAKITYKITGTAHIRGGETTLIIKEERKFELKAGQIIHIADQERTITEVKDGYPIFLPFALEDNDYQYYIVTKQIRPIEYLIK